MLTDENGAVRSGDHRIDCGDDCSARYKRRAVVTLRASPEANFAFQRWSGACIGSAPTCRVALRRSARVQASFERVSRTLSVTVGGPGAVASDPAGIQCGSTDSQCSGSFEQGSTVRLTAAPAAEGTFGAWGGACGGSSIGTCEIPVGGDVGAFAAFGHASPDPDDPTLTVTTQGVAVSSNPPGIDCPGTCSATFGSGTPVTLTAAGPVSWGQACVGALLSCTLVLDASTGVTATAATVVRQTAGLNVTVSGPGTVSAGRQIRCGGTRGTLLDCEGLYDIGTVVVLKAKPARRRGTFAGWSGFCRGKHRRCTLHATAPKTVSAVFRR